MFGRKTISNKDATNSASPSSALKTGYLVKRAVVGGGNWKKRYFVMSEQTLTYYTDDRHLNKARGDVLLTADTVVDEVEHAEKPHCFTVTTPQKTLYCSAANHTSLTDWVLAIRCVIRRLQSSLRGYLIKRAIVSGSNWQKRYFLLNHDSLAYYQDEFTTARVKGVFQLTRRTIVDSDLKTEGTDYPFTFVVMTRGRKLYIAAKNEDEKQTWANAIRANIKELPEDDSDLQELAHQSDMTGYLTKRAVVSGENWKLRFFVLKGSRLLYLKDEHCTEAKGEFLLTPDSTVYKTRLRDFTFELVTAQKVLHAQATNEEEQERWIAQIRSNISKSTLATEDPIREAAMLRQDEFYDKVFEDKRPLGVTLAQHHEWAVVKVSNEAQTGISVGSVLTGVNGTSVVLSTYKEAVALLRGWQPPLTLTFRRPPSKKGPLAKLGRKKNMMKMWNTRFFILSNGSLRYSTEEGDEIRGEFPLIGTAVTLVPYNVTGQFFCFKLVSGAGSLILKALTVNEMMSWAAALYHAITVANGSGYLVEAERSRVARENEEEAKRAEAARLRAEAEETERAIKEAEMAKAAAEEAKRVAAAAEEAAKEEARRIAQEAQEAADRAKAAADEKARAEAEAEAAAAQAALVAAEEVAKQQREAAVEAERVALEAVEKAREEEEEKQRILRAQEAAAKEEVAIAYEREQEDIRREAKRVEFQRQQAARVAEEEAAAAAAAAASGEDPASVSNEEEELSPEEQKDIEEAEAAELTLLKEGAHVIETEMREAQTLRQEKQAMRAEQSGEEGSEESSDDDDDYVPSAAVSCSASRRSSVASLLASRQNSTKSLLASRQNSTKSLLAVEEPPAEDTEPAVESKKSSPAHSRRTSDSSAKVPPAESSGSPEGSSKSSPDGSKKSSPAHSRRTSDSSAKKSSPDGSKNSSPEGSRKTSVVSTVVMPSKEPPVPLVKKGSASSLLSSVASMLSPSRKSSTTRESTGSAVESNKSPAHSRKTSAASMALPPRDGGGLSAVSEGSNDTESVCTMVTSSICSTDARELASAMAELSQVGEEQTPAPAPTEAPAPAPTSRDSEDSEKKSTRVARKPVTRPMERTERVARRSPSPADPPLRLGFDATKSSELAATAANLRSSRSVNADAARHKPRPSIDLRNSDELRVEMELAFDNITDSSAGMAVVSFTNMLRAITHEHNLFKEMQLFQKFNISGNGSLDKSEFVNGVLLLNDEQIINGLRSYATDVLVML